MSDNLVYLDVATRLNIPADRVIDAAKGNLDRVVIIGYDHDGAEYFASSIADGGEVNWLLDRCKHKLLRMCDEDGE